MSQADSGLPLVLADEADARQAAELLSLFETEFSAELVLASSAQQALTTLGARVPDLVLTSALIPPKDEAALTAWLRRLGDAAAHVQTVTIPALAATETPARSVGGRTFGLGRQKPAVSAPDGCDRAVFADYVTLYLDLASSERERMSSRV